MKGTAGIPTMKPGWVYQGVERAFGSGYDIPLTMRNIIAMALATTYARAALRPSQPLRPQAAANAAVAA